MIVVPMVTKASKHSFRTMEKAPAPSVVGNEFVMQAFVNSDSPTEWKTYRRYIANPSKEELSTNSMLETVSELESFGKNGLTIPVGAASVELSFLQMKMINLIEESSGR